MAQEKMSRFVYVRLYISDDCEVEYVCSGCGMKKPWKGEPGTTIRCENKERVCNGVMELQFINEGGEENVRTGKRL